MEQNITYNLEQKLLYQSIVQFVYHSPDKFLTINGVAGSGKTQIILDLLPLFETSYNLLVASFTNRVINSIRRKAPETIGSRFQTLHSLFYTAVFDDYDNILYFREKTKDEILSAIGSDRESLLIVDESQMVSFSMLNAILDNFPGVILFFGDNHQLPPVGCEEDNIMELPDIEITKITRVKADNSIVQLSKEIRETGSYDRLNYKNKNEIEFIKKNNVTVKYLQQNKPDIILCGTNKVKNKMNRLSRIANGYTPTDKPQPGEPLIALEQVSSDIKRNEILTVSNTEEIENTNGDVYYNVYFEETMNDSFKVVPEFLQTENKNDNKFFDEWGNEIRGYSPFGYAYATTVHKAIGLEFDNVLFIRDNVSYFLDQRKFDYTAVTRAKEKIIIAE